MDSLAEQCDQLHHFNKSEQCQFVQNNSDCQNVDGFLNYITLVYCDYKLTPSEAILILAVWVFFLFTVIAIATDNFFCPALHVISDTLRLSQNVAGVTILAFGNGISDIFVSIAATAQDRPELIISDLFGGGMFVTCIILGTIMIFSPYRFEIPSGPFLRDIIFYLISAFWAFAIYYKGAVKLFDALGFLVLYLIYVLTVILCPKMCDRFCLLPGEIYDDSNTLIAEDPCNASVENSINNAMSDDDSERTPLLSGNVQHTTAQSPGWAFLRAISPVDVDRWSLAPWYLRMQWIIQAPSVFILKLTIPLVDKEVKNNNWCRILNSLHLVTGPVFVIFAFRCATKMIAGLVPVWAIVLGVSAVFGLTIFCITSDHHPPQWHKAFAFLGFSISIVWIYILANEIVNALKTIGIVLGINDVILGLTVLAWGNSVGDFIANISVAKSGSPTMAVSACIGGPLLNLLVGMGLPFSIKLVTQSGDIRVRYNSSITILSGFLFASLVCTMLAMLILRFRMHHSYGVYLLILYAAFMICAILNAVHIL